MEPELGWSEIVYSVLLGTFQNAPLGCTALFAIVVATIFMDWCFTFKVSHNIITRCATIIFILQRRFMEFFSHIAGYYTPLLEVLLKNVSLKKLH